MSAESEIHITDPRSRDDQPDQPSPQANNPLILVVDDDPMNRAVMRAILRKLGYPFHVATNGREAVEAIQREAYGAVLMDCLMPEMDGYEAATLTRQYEREHQRAGQRRRVPIIAVTAVAIQGARERCIAAGMDDFLSKPVVTSSVASVLDRWLAETTGDATWTPELAPSPAEPEDDAVDRQALDALRELDPEGGSALVVEIVGDFTTEVSRRFPALRVAAASGDTDTLTQEAHSIAGCASLVGAMHVERLARSLGAGAPGDPTHGTRSAALLIDTLEAAFTRARLALESIAASPR